MNQFLARAKQPKGYLMPAISLNESESKHYHGCGNAVAVVKENIIEELIYLGESLELTNILDRLEEDGEFYIGMASGHEFCDPKELKINNANSMAHLARLHGEANDMGDI